MLLGAQFCSDSFCSVSLNGPNEGVSYSLYARQVTIIFMLIKELLRSPNHVLAH